MNVNTVVIAGNLTRDPETRYLNSGTAVGNFTLALNRTWTQDGQKKEEVSFIKVVVWGKLAEICGEYLSKGRGALVEGRLKQETWEAENGSKREHTVVVAQSVQFFGNKVEKKQETEPNPDEIPF